MMVSNVHSDEDSAHVSYFHNISQNNNHWVEFDLEGVQSNRDAYGSHVTIWLDGRPTLAEVDGGSSHASKSSSIVHFGLGESTLVDSVQIVFPSGITTTLTSLAVDQRHSIIHSLLATGDDLYHGSKRNLYDNNNKNNNNGDNDNNPSARSSSRSRSRSSSRSSSRSISIREGGRG